MKTSTPTNRMGDGGDVMRSGLVAFVRIAGCSAGLGVLSLVTGSPVAAAEPDPAARTIVVDAGHGGIDGGACGAGIVEKTVTLDVAGRVAHALAADGWQVWMTRDRDTDVSRLYKSHLPTRHKRDLQNRLDFVRFTRAVGVISIHVNSSANSRDRGPLVFYDVHSEAGRQLAQSVQAALNRVADSTQRAVGRRNLFLIRHAPCPAILVELGFLTNASDAARLKDPHYLQRTALAMADAASHALQKAVIPPPYQKHPVTLDWVKPSFGTFDKIRVQ